MFEQGRRWLGEIGRRVLGILYMIMGAGFIVQGIPPGGALSKRLVLAVGVVFLFLGAYTTGTARRPKNKRP